MKQSAGIVLYKIRDGELRVLLVHPGGPFWARKDAATWSIPKGEYTKGEDPLRAAIREFSEETGVVPGGDFYSLGEVVQSNQKRIAAWACEGDLDPTQLVSNCCEIEWPPKSGERLTIPEIDRAEWFPLNEARVKLTPGQLPFLERLEAHLTADELSH